MITASLIRSARPPFLLLTPVCVLLGAAAAGYAGYVVPPADAALVLLGGLAAHVSVNTLNEYADFKSGLDLRTERTPFSGGSGALPACPAAAPAVLTIGIAALLVAVAVGAYFVLRQGLALLPLGMLGILLVVSYTERLNRNPWLCLIAPGLGFGLVMVVGSHVALSGAYTGLSLLLGLIAFCLVNNVLLLSQYPDARADQAVGRRHLVIVYGVRAGNLAYGSFMLGAAGLLAAGLAAGMLPPLALLAFIPLTAAAYAWYGAVRCGLGLGREPRYLAANVAAALLTPAVIALAMGL